MYQNEIEIILDEDVERDLADEQCQDEDIILDPDVERELAEINRGDKKEPPKNLPQVKIEFPATLEERLKQDDEEVDELLRQLDEKETEKPKQFEVDFSRSIEPEKKTYLIQQLQSRPRRTKGKRDREYTVVQKLPRASIPYLLQIYHKKASAGKLYDIIIQEVMTELRRMYGGERHLKKYGQKNFWIALDKIYSRTYRDKKRLQKGVELIVEELQGKLHYAFTTDDRKDYLVLDLVEGTILTNGNKEYIKVEDQDYKLTNAELIFFRQIQAAIGPNNQQRITVETFLEFGMIAWHYLNNRKRIKEKTAECIKKLQEDKFITMKKVAGSLYDTEEHKKQKGATYLTSIIRKVNIGVEKILAAKRGATV